MTDTDARQIGILTGGEMPRVWSLLVTVFGDLTLDTGGALSGAALNQITGAIGIKPEAVRVALHRLRKDGWIESERRGRQSRYRLTETGRAESERARPRIYGPAPLLQTSRIILTEPGRTAPEAAVQVGPGVFLSITPTDAAECLCLPMESVPPDWMRDRVSDKELCAASAVCAERFALLGEALDGEVSPLQTAVLRVLIVHTWRRIALKAPLLPDEAMADGWRGAECRALFTSLLDQLPRRAPEALDAARQSERAA